MCPGINNGRHFRLWEEDMKFASAAVSQGSVDCCLSELFDRVAQDVAPDEADLAMIFVTAHFEDEFDLIRQTLTQRCPGAVRLGCTTEGVIGGRFEFERMPAISLMLARMPQVRLGPFHLTQEDFAAANDEEEAPTALMDLPEHERSTLLLLGEPFSFPMSAFLDYLNESLPNTLATGGMASAGESPEQNILLLNDETYQEGVVGVSLSGNVGAYHVVSQGCRPIGEHMIVTKAHENFIVELGGKPALEQLQQTVYAIGDAERRLAQQAIFVGRAIDEYQDNFGKGDFLVQNLIGIVPQAGALVIAAPAKIGTTVQFHVRDADCADEDLRAMLSPFSGDVPMAKPAGAMLFSCNGRGTRMWPKPGHDAAAVAELCNDVPTAGFFAAGELGPVGGKNFVHGHTASILFLGPA